MRVLIAGGGTGGHLFPGIALAEELRARGGHEVLFVGTARGLEARVVPAQGYPLELIEVTGLKRAGLAGTLRGLFRLPAAMLSSLRILRRFRPDVVIGVGGYASGPVVLAAAVTRRATAVLENNSVPGVTNRVLGRVVKRIFLAFDGARAFFPRRKIVLSGNPIRRDMRSALTAAVTASGAGPSTLFICGGSQGAHAVNEAAAEALAQLAAKGVRPRVIHQTGAADKERIAARYAAAGIDAGVHDFIVDMASCYAQADLVLARAGATTISELTAIGRATIFVPFPFAADDHQTANARALVEAGAARSIPQAEATPERLAGELGALLGDAEARTRMAEAMRAQGRPAAAEAIVDELERLCAAASRDDGRGRRAA